MIIHGWLLRALWCYRRDKEYRKSGRNLYCNCGVICKQFQQHVLYDEIRIFHSGSQWLSLLPQTLFTGVYKKCNLSNLTLGYTIARRI